MIVILNNGTRIKIPNETAQSIFQGLLKSQADAQKWHCVMNIGTNQFSGFNLLQVSAICPEEDVITARDEIVKQLDLFRDSLPNKDQSGIFWSEKFRHFLLEKNVQP